MKKKDRETRLGRAAFVAFVVVLAVLTLAWPLYQMVVEGDPPPARTAG